MYTRVFAEIGGRFPFTEFECAVLRQLNYAPSQIHPNSWGFIRAFEVLMDYLQEEPSLGLFFYLFQAKGVERGIWVTLSSHQEQTKVPDCNTASLKSFFKQRAEKELFSSHVVKVEKGSEVNKPSEKRKLISLKRMRTKKTSGKRVIDLTEGRRYGKGMASEDVAEFGANSLWSENYPFPMVADEHFQAKADVDLLDSVGKVASARYIQVQAARLMCISRRWELQGLEEESSKKADAVELERKLLLSTEQVALKEKENGMLKEENAKLKVKVAKLVKDKKDLETRVVEVCGERKEAEVSKKAHGFEMFAVAWDKAKAQAELFAPGVSFEKMDPVKVVYNGELVDDDQVPAEGSDDHNPAE
ncbi:hypothetical protein PIB30_075163 [Stylosanthes scabra]|uniref:Transposase (putative) gypsy type domain-containing protein n=1 Tax=Stylosanthes scabra TaxID=79078 RepID=A0ABU6URM9_9FABA|nr:hypothetical protein [Stylosanthes scabra]